MLTEQSGEVWHKNNVRVAPLWVLEEIAQYIKQRQEVRERGLNLQIPKCKLRTLGGSQQLLDEALALLATDEAELVLQQFTFTVDGVKALGCPIGTEQYIEAELRKVGQQTVELIQACEALSEPQVALELLRYVTGVTQVTHLLRTVPPRLTKDMCIVVDEAMRNALGTAVIIYSISASATSDVSVVWELHHA